MEQSAATGELFSALAVRLGHSNASLLYVCHRVGINIFDPDYADLELSEVQVQAITRFVNEEKPAETGSSQKKKKPPRKPKKAKKKQDEDEPRSLVDMAEYFDVSIEHLRKYVTRTRSQSLLTRTTCQRTTAEFLLAFSSLLISIHPPLVKKQKRSFPSST